MEFYHLEHFAQYGSDAYGTSVYGDGSESGTPLADTGYNVAPGFIFGTLMLIVSIVLLVYRRPRKRRQAKGQN